MLIHRSLKLDSHQGAAEDRWLAKKQSPFDPDQAGEGLLTMETFAGEFEQALKNMDRVTAQQIIDTATATGGAMLCVDQVVLPALEHIGRQWEQGQASLTLVKKVVESYGGNIWVESGGLRQGSCFKFTLPGATPSATAKD